MPTEADDTLQSVQHASVLDLISEGEIEGLEDGNKSISGKTPIEAHNRSNLNFTIVTRTGTQTQTHISGDFGSTQSTSSILKLLTTCHPIDYRH